DPLRNVRGPHDDALSRLDADRHQPSGNHPSLALEGGKRVAGTAFVDERLVVRQRRSQARQQIADSDVAGRGMHSGVEVYAARDGPGENTGQVKNMSKSIAIALSTVVAGAIAAAQTGRPLNLRGDRFKPLTWEQLTVQQKTMVDDLLSGSRSSLNGPFNVLLRSPEMGNLAQKLGEYVRFHTSVPRRLNEMA